MQIAAEDLGYLTDTCRPKYETTLTQSLLPFWLDRNYDEKHGAFLPAMDINSIMDGRRIDESKPGWSPQRSLATLALLYQHYSKEEYRDEAMVERLEPMLEQTLNFVLDGTIFRRDGRIGCYNGVVQEGGKALIDRKTGQPFPESLFVNAFAVYAISLYAQTGLKHRREQVLGEADCLLEDVKARHEQPNQTGLWYPTNVPEGTRLHPSEMILLLACHHLAKAKTEYGGSMFLANKYRQNIMEKYLCKPAGRKGEYALLEYLTSDGKRISDPDIPESTLVNPGHAIESLGFVMRYDAYFREAVQNELYIEDIEKIAQAMLDLFELGWDRQPGFNSMKLYVDAETRQLHDLDEEKRPWWSVCEAATQALYAYSLTGDSRLLSMHREASEAYFDFYFDEEIGEAIQKKNAQGEPDLRDVAFPSWDMMHAIRALLEMMETTDSIKREFSVKR